MKAILFTLFLLFSLPLFSNECLLSHHSAYPKKNNLLYLHTVEKIVNDGEILELEDGSQWSMNWLWRLTTKNWNKGDLIVVTYFDDNVIFPSYKIENLTQKKIVWGTLFRSTQRNSPKARSIVKLTSSGSLILNDADCFLLENLDEINYWGWKENDLIFILASALSPDRCDLLNMTRFSFLRDVAYLTNQKR